MDEDRLAALETICADYRGEFVPPRLSMSPADWDDPERCNRAFVSMGLAGANSFFFGADLILAQLDALCRVASVSRVVDLTDSSLLEDLVPRILGMVCREAESALIPHLNWLLAAIRGRAGDISGVWNEEDTETAFGILANRYKHPLPAVVLMQSIYGEPPLVLPSPRAVEVACRIGLVSWTESVLHTDGASVALRELLREFPDKDAGVALHWFGEITCLDSPFEPRCDRCRVFNCCMALSLGLW